MTAPPPPDDHRVSSPVGLHRVLEPTGRRSPSRRPPSASTRGRSCGPTRCASPSRRSTSTPRRSASSPRSTRATARWTAAPSVTRCSTSSRPAARCRTPSRARAGMLIGTVEEVGPESPLGLRVGGPRRHARLALADAPRDHRRPRALGRPRPSRCPPPGTPSCSAAVIAATLPADLDPHLALMVMDVCGAPALAERVVGEYAARGVAPTVAVLGGAGKSGSLSPGRRPIRRRGPHHRRRPRRAPSARCSSASGLADAVVRGRRPRRRSPCAAAVEPPAARPTSRSSASTCPAARAARSSPPPRAAPSSSSRMATIFAGRGARRRGPRRRRADARRQRLRARARRDGAATRAGGPRGQGAVRGATGRRDGRI